MKEEEIKYGLQTPASLLGESATKCKWMNLIQYWPLILKELLVSEGSGSETSPRAETPQL